MLTPFVIPANPFVIPAKAGIQGLPKRRCAPRLDPRLRGDDEAWVRGDDEAWVRGDDEAWVREDDGR